MNGAISNQRKSGTEIEVATGMITRVTFLTISWKGFMHVCIVSILLYIVYTVIWSNQKMSAGLRPQWEAERSTVCRQKSRHSWSAEKDIPPCQKNILYYNLWRNVFLNDIKCGHPCWQYLCNLSKDFQYINHQSECFLEWIDEESQKYLTLLIRISCLCLVSALFLVNVMSFVLPSTNVILSTWKVLEQKL